MSTAASVVEKYTTEADFRNQIAQAAALHGWLWFHDPDIRKCPNCGHVTPDEREPGFPDLVLCRGVNVVFLECKREKGTVTPEQQRWIDALSQARYVSAAVVRPHDWPDVEDVLRRGAR